MIKLSGELDITALPAATKLLRSVEGAEVAIVDMRSVSYIDSAALGMLMDAKRRVGAGGGVLRIVSADGRLQRLLTVTGIDKSVRVYEDLEEAMTEAK